jgi:DnaK suppressor protein
VNKHKCSEIKKIILAQIDLLVEELPTLQNAVGEKLRLERLDAALMRIDADNFGVCFKCEKTIPMSRLRILPESTICIDCLEAPTV